MMRCALYARVSTTDQTAENQLRELLRYAEARGWSVVSQFVDEGVSGAKQSRPQLDAMLKEAKRRRFDAIAIWSLDRLGRDLKHLIGLLDELHALGVTVVSLREGMDWSTASGRLQAQMLAMIAEFERSRIQERVRAGLQRAKAQGRRLGRPRSNVSQASLDAVSGLSLAKAAAQLKVSRSTLQRLRRGQKPPRSTPHFRPGFVDAAVARTAVPE